MVLFASKIYVPLHLHSDKRPQSNIQLYFLKKIYFVIWNSIDRYCTLNIQCRPVENLTPSYMQLIRVKSAAHLVTPLAIFRQLFCRYSLKRLSSFSNIRHPYSRPLDILLFEV